MRAYYLALLALLLAGCATTSPPTHFYALTGEVSTPPGEGGQKTSDLVIGIGPVRLPAMLDRPQIVTRLEDHRINVAEFHRWAGKLDGNMTRLIAARAMQQLDTQQVFIHPWSARQKVDYQVRVDVYQFDGVLGKEAILAGTFTLLDGTGEMSTRAFRFSGVPAGGSYGDLVLALGALLTELSDRVMSDIRRN